MHILIIFVLNSRCSFVLCSLRGIGNRAGKKQSQRDIIIPLPCTCIRTMATPNPPTASSSTPPVNRHAMTAVEKQRMQLEKLLKDPTKVAYVPPPPKEKTIRPAREMMKNVQGSSAGAGSGEFHVYKASRRREYERLKLLEETVQKVRVFCPDQDLPFLTCVAIGNRRGRI